MVKKWLSALLIAAICITFSACSENYTAQPNSPANTAETLSDTNTESETKRQECISDASTTKNDEGAGLLPSESVQNETKEPADEKKPTAESTLPQPTVPSSPNTSEDANDSKDPQTSPSETQPPVTEPHTEEPSSPPASVYDVEKLVAEYINRYRTEQGSTATTILPKMTEVARYRARQIVTDFSHNSIPDACSVLKYGEFVDMTLYGGDASDSYYIGYNREAIGKGDWIGTADQIAQRIAGGFKNSKNHWSYVGDDQYKYMAVGVIEESGKWFCCICMSEKNYDK